MADTDNCGPQLPPVKITAEEIEAAEARNEPTPKLKRTLRGPTVFSRAQKA